MRRPEIAIALDLPTARAALALVDTLGSEVSWYKVGSVIALTGGSALVRELTARGKSVFLDLKWHDIPSTVAGAVAAASSLGVSVATVHLAGGRSMLEAAAKARGRGMKLVGVGVLTSLDAMGFGTVVGREVVDVGAEQVRLMELGLELLDGFVVAPGETARARRLAGEDAFLVTPGIRLAGDDLDDQKRTATPAEAARAGSDLLVVGRPVTGARDAADVVRSIRAELTPPLARSPTPG